MRVLHLFLVSSPLQTITVSNILKQYLGKPDEDICLFCEGDRLKSQVDESLWTKVIYGNDTRPSINKAKKSIRTNLNLLKPLVDSYEKIILYVGDLYWLFNNTMFSMLKNRKLKYFKCNLFDEGLVLYRHDKEKYINLKKQFVKFIWQRLHGFSASLLWRDPIQIPCWINRIYCYHPGLLKAPDWVEVKDLDVNYISDYLEEQRSSLPELPVIGERTLLYLSQPYYRVMPLDKWKQVITSLKNYARTLGVKDIYVKPHDGDTREWINYLLEEGGFKLFTKVRSGVAIELLASELSFDYVVSTGSSALFNLKLFGYNGKVISYGLEKSAISRKIKKLHEASFRIYKHVGVETVD